MVLNLTENEFKNCTLYRIHTYGVCRCVPCQAVLCTEQM